MDSHHRSLATGVVAGVSLASLLFVLLRRSSREERRPHHSLAGPLPRSRGRFPCTHEEAGEWLHSLALSRAAVNALTANGGIDGPSLAAMTAQDLVRLGIAAQDRAVLLAALGSSDELPASRPVPGDAAVLAQRLSARRSPPSRPVAAIPATNATTVVVPLNAFLTDAEGLFADLVYPPSAGEDERQAAADAQQQRLRMAARLYDLLDGFHGLSTAEQSEAMLPLARRLNVVLTQPTPRPSTRRHVSVASGPPRPGVSPVPVTAAARTATLPTAAAAPTDADFADKLKPLYEMVDSFLKVLGSPELNGCSAADMEPLAERIRVQIARVAGLAAGMPPPHNAQLARKCEAVAQLLAARVGRAEAAQPQAEAPSLVASMRRLGEIFQQARSDELLTLDPRRRLVTVAAMRDEVRSIGTSLAAGPSGEQKATCLNVCETVLGLLDQLYQLTTDEARLADADAEQEGADGADEGAQAVDTDERHQQPSVEFSAAAGAFLKRTAEVLQSPAFTTAPASTRREVLRDLRHSVDALRAEAARLGPAERGPAAAVLGQARALLERAEAAIDVAADPEAAAEAAEPAQPAEGSKEVAQGSAEGLDASVTMLESIFKLLNSPSFDAATLPEKRAIAGELLERVRTLRAPILGALQGDANHPIVKELVTPLEELLTHMASVHGPSEQFMQVMETLQEMDEVLSSDALRQAPRQRQEGIARAVTAQLQRVVGSLDSLAPSEQAAVERAVEPLHERLVALIRGEAPAGTAAAAAEEEAAAPAEAHDGGGGEGLAEARAVMAELRGIMGIVTSADFAAATVGARADIVEECLQSLAALRRRCAGLPAVPRGQLLPVVERLFAELTSLTEGSPEGEAEDDEGAAAREEREGMFASIRDITTELRRGAGRGLSLSEAELGPLRQLLTMVDSIGDLSPQEKVLRDAFEAELDRSSDTVEDSGDVAEEGEKGGEGEVADGDDGLSSFLRVFANVQAALSEKTFTSVAQLLPLMSIVEGAMSAAEERGIAWQSDPASVVLVSDVLSKIQDVQAKVRGPGDATAASVTALEEAKRRLEQDPPASSAGLAPYLALLKKYMSSPTFTPAEMTAMEGLRDAIVAAGARLQGAEQDGPASEEGEQEAGEEQARQESRIADALLEVSDKLRERNLSENELDENEAVVNQIDKATRGKADFADAIHSVREQIRLQRLLNNPDAVAAEGSDDGHNASVFREDDGDTSSVAVDAIVAPEDLPKVCYDGVDGGAENELTLLPKIEERIALPTEQFIASSTLFDIQNISKVLLHLTTRNATVSKSPALRKRLDNTKASFITQLAAFRSSENPSTDAEASQALRVTGEDRTDVEDGSPVREFTVFTAEESDQYPVNESLMCVLQEVKNAVSPTLKSEAAADWAGKSAAILISATTGVAADEQARGTALSELVLLHEVLTKRYGFDVVTITDPILTAETLMRTVKSIAQSAPARLLVYYCTPPSREMVAVPHGMTFHDDSVLLHKQLLAATEALVERVVVAHSLPRKLEVTCRLRDKRSAAMSVGLTSKAAAEVARTRCWLFSGIFTPVVVELLCRDERLMLCPEDLLNYAITATTRMKVEFGSFTDSEPAGMAFFLPVDDS